MLHNTSPVGRRGLLGLFSELHEVGDRLVELALARRFISTEQDAFLAAVEHRPFLSRSAVEAVDRVEVVLLQGREPRDLPGKCYLR